MRELKTEIIKRWGVISLLDILKEADLHINFTQYFKSPAVREVLDRETLQKRLLLCLYGMGTNTGLKRVSQGDHGQTNNELIYTRHRYINQEHLRTAIIDIANATSQVRQPQIWGEGTTTCASDPTQFGSWDQNLMTEWHLRYEGNGTTTWNCGDGSTLASVYTNRIAASHLSSLCRTWSSSQNHFSLSVFTIGSLAS